MKKRIALISEHASPFGILGGIDSGGQNVYVGQLAKNLAVLDYKVDVFTRREISFARGRRMGRGRCRLFMFPQAQQPSSAKKSCYRTWQNLQLTCCNSIGNNVLPMT